MIAFSREMFEEHEKSTPMLVVGPCIVVQQAGNQPASRDATACDTTSIATKVARQQAELAMLQRALIRCGLTGHETGRRKD